MIKLSVLASGSKGNSIFVEMGGIRFLVDAGISTRRIKTSLDSLGVPIESLSGIFITHEHIDHVQGLKTLTQKYEIPVFSREGTLKQIASKIERKELLHPIKESFFLEGLKVESFNIQHDAVEPVGYSFGSSEKCTVATDLGFVSSNVQEAIEGAEVLVLETNHDIELLKKGSYPWHLKRRILSNRGHLSNNDAAWALVRMKRKPKKVFLAHLSEENNRPQLAKQAVSDILKNEGVLEVEAMLALTSQNEVVSL